MRFPERLVTATHNAKKGREMAQVLGQLFPETVVFGLTDFSGAPEPEESGDTYAENAGIKARSAAQFTGEWALADDAGLEVDAMDGAPGLHSKRFEGEDSSFEHKMGRILEALKGLEGSARSARFRCCIVLASPSGDELVFEATCEGRIAQAPQGEHGFGYDPIFELPDGRTMAMLTPEQKHQVSHRGKVLRALADHFRG